MDCTIDEKFKTLSLKAVANSNNERVRKIFKIMQDKALLETHSVHIESYDRWIESCGPDGIFV